MRMAGDLGFSAPVVRWGHAGAIARKIETAAASRQGLTSCRAGQRAAPRATPCPWPLGAGRDDELHWWARPSGDLPMIDFEIGDEFALLVDTTRGFAADHLAASMRDTESARRVDDAVRAAYAEIGLADLEIPESLDGAGLGCLARCLVNEELAAHDAGATVALDTLGPALYAALELGGAAAVSALRDACEARPGARAALLFEDTDRQPGEPVSLEAAWVPADHVAAVVLLGPGGVSLVTEGIGTTPVRGAGLRAAGASRLRVDDAPIAAAWHDAAAAHRARARTRLWVASLLLGVLRAACDFSRDYSTERQAFGRPIAHHQALAFLVVEMAMALESARLLVHEAAWRIDRALPADAEAAGALAECIDAARFIGPNGVQILGGHGFMADYPVEKHMREARALGLLAGGLDAAVEEAGRSLCAAEHPLAFAGLAEGAA